MSLINDLFEHPLEPGYAEAAARRGAHEAEVSMFDRLRRSPAMLFGLLALGFLLTVAVLQVRQDASVVSAERTSLTERIEQESERTAELERQLSAIEDEVVEIEAAAQSNESVSRELRESMATLQTAAGTSELVGPGVLITMNNAEGAPETGGEPGSHRVLDLDLQVVVNGLWAAGAEAISINGERITALSAIRQADNVILVNIRPLGPPYEISAIGDPQTLAARFTAGSGGAWLEIASQAGIRYTIENVESLRLPGSAASLQVAEPILSRP